MSDDFVRDLEDELVAAARFRAARRARRLPALRRASVARGGAPRRAGAGRRAAAPRRARPRCGVRRRPCRVRDRRRADAHRTRRRRPRRERAAAGARSRSRRWRRCRAAAPRRGDQPAADRLPPMAIFERAQQEPDGLPSTVEPDELPLTGYDARETRRPGIDAEVTLVPSRGVRDGCTDDDGPGCLRRRRDARTRRLRAASPPPTSARPRGRVAQLGAGAARRRRPRRGRRGHADGRRRPRHGAGRGQRVRGDPAGRPARDAGEADAAAAGQLRSRRRAGAARPRDRPARSARARAHARTRRDRRRSPSRAVSTRSRSTARGYWGGGDGVDYWAVPVVTGGDPCAPATEVCVVAESEQGADALCSDGPDAGAAKWRIAPLPGGRAVGLRPRAGPRDRGRRCARATGPREVDAGLNVFGGVLPFAVADDAAPERRGRRTRGSIGEPASAWSTAAAMRSTSPTDSRARASRRLATVTPGVKAQPRNGPRCTGSPAASHARTPSASRRWSAPRSGADHRSASDATTGTGRRRARRRRGRRRTPSVVWSWRGAPARS